MARPCGITGFGQIMMHGLETFWWTSYPRNNSSEDLQNLMLGTPLPNTGENCQTWVTKVVEDAVQLGYLGESVLEKLQTVPTAP